MTCTRKGSTGPLSHQGDRMKTDGTTVLQRDRKAESEGTSVVAMVREARLAVRPMPLHGAGPRLDIDVDFAAPPLRPARFVSNPDAPGKYLKVTA